MRTLPAMASALAAAATGIAGVALITLTPAPPAAPVDQDGPGVQGAPISIDGGRDVSVEPLANGDRAVALCNDTGSPRRVTTSASAIGMPAAPAYRVRDPRASTDRETAGALTVTVPAHGTVTLRVARDARWAVYPPAVDAATDLPAARPGTRTYVEPGGSTTVTTTATNSGRLPALFVENALAAPDGWTVQATSRRTGVLVGPGRRLATTWTVTAPAGARPGTYELTTSVSYEPDQSVSTDTVQVDVAAVRHDGNGDGGNGGNGDHADRAGARLTCT